MGNRQSLPLPQLTNTNPENTKQTTFRDSHQPILQKKLCAAPDPQSPILNPVYDSDGNATAYPLPVAPGTNSTLVWNAENRLISSTVGNTTTDYLYDAQSRRIALRRSGLQPLSSLGQTTLYLYDGWNCIAEYQIHNSSFSLHTSRLWGLDLSGTLQGAGGVGGLLCESHISNPQSPVYYPTYDGNGNVSEYLASNGSIAAHYEYEPFGITNTTS